MKVKNFRINIVFASSVSVLWALVYVPEGLPIRTLNTGSVVTSPLHLCTNLSSSNHERYLLECGREFRNECRATQSLEPTRQGISIRAMGSSLSGDPSRTSQESKPSSLSTTRAV